MPYHLPRERKIECLALLSEGNSIRSVERLTGIHRDTVMRLLVRFGKAAASYLDYAFGNLFVRHAQLDEIWTFVAATPRRTLFGPSGPTYGGYATSRRYARRTSSAAT